MRGPFDGNIDSDNDGLKNWQEYVAGTDPIDKASLLALEGMKVETGANGFVLRWPSKGGKVYQILRTDNLVNGFSVVYSDISATPPMNTFTDTGTTTTGPYFYRIQVQQ